MILRNLTLLVCALLFALSVCAQAPTEVERQILAKLETISATGTYSGDYREDDNSSANSELSGLLLKQGHRLDVLRYGFPKLKDKMGVATSKDGKLRIYSWDTETGGTMHEHSSVIQYQGASGKVHTWTYDPPADESEDAPVASGIGTGGYYMRILQVDSTKRPIYLAISLSIGCGQCHGQSVEAVQIDGDSVIRDARIIKTASGLTNSIDFAYAPATIPKSLSEDSLVRFNVAEKSFSIPVVIEDEEAGNGRVTTRTITYRFNGTHFVKVR